MGSCNSLQCEIFVMGMLRNLEERKRIQKLQITEKNYYS